MSFDNLESSARIIQEIVPGKQITLAHILANPDKDLVEQLGFCNLDKTKGASLGILTMSPSELCIIGADVAIKTSDVSLGFLDHTSGTLIISGNVSAVEASLQAVLQFCKTKLNFTTCHVTKT